MPWVYILECADTLFYVGSTTNLEQRMREHDESTVSWTSKRKPLKLVWSHEFERIDEAFAIERRIHGWSRAKKQALIAGDIDMLRSLSKRRGGSSPGG